MREATPKSLPDAPRTGFRPIALFFAFPLASLLAVAALVRAIAWTRTAVLFNDGPVFLSIAEAMREGRWAEALAHPYHPLYPFLVSLLMRTGLSGETSAIVISILGGLLGIVALHYFLRRFYDDDIAWLGAWLLVLHPWAVDFSSDVMSDGLYMGFYLSGFAAMAELVRKPSIGAACLCAVGSGLAYLVRPEGLGLLAIAFCLVVGRMGFDVRYRRAAGVSAVVLLLAGMLVVAPYVLALSWQAGELIVTQKKSVASLAAGSAAPPPVWSPSTNVDQALPMIWWPQSAAPAGAGQPPRDVTGAIEALSRVLRTSAAALRYEVLLFVVIGCFALRGRATDAWRIATFGLPILLYTGLLVLLVWGAGYVSRRHALAVWIPLLGVAAVGWRSIADSTWLRRDVEGPRWPVREAVRSRIVCAALALLLIFAWGPRDLRERRPDRAALREAAEWIAKTRPKQGGVAAEKLRIAYYADAPYVPLIKVNGSGDTLEGTLRAAGARWVVVDEARLGEYPGLGERLPDWLIEVHRVDSRERTALVLELIETPAG